MAKKKLTLSELSNELRLSKTLVSMVLNGKGDQHKISTKTQELVLKKAKELNYNPDSFARKLRTGKSHLIGLIIPDISNIFFARLARVIEDTLRKQKYNLIILSTDENPERERGLIDLLLSWQVDGFIVAPCQEKPDYFLELTKNEDLPFVFIDRHYNNNKLSKVIINNEESATKAVEFLVQKKKKSITYFNLTPSHLSSLAERRKGFSSTAKKHKIPHEVVDINYNSIEKDLEKYFVLNKKRNKPDAFLTANNNIAIPLLQLLERNSLLKTKPIEICSFDDHPAFEISTPKVSAIAQPVDDIAKKAAQLLLQKLKQEGLVKKIVLNTKLIKR